jgi:hypothetical protein
VAAKKQESRASIIDSVTSPLGFFSLAIIITEAVLLALAAKAQGSDFTMLVIAAIANFILILMMVFVLLLVPTAREFLVRGRSDTLPGGASFDLAALTENDVLAILNMRSGGTIEDLGYGLPNQGKTPQQRAAHFQQLGLIQIPKKGNGHFMLTDRGVDVLRLLRRAADMSARSRSAR